jgi:hypothetical protein
MLVNIYQTARRHFPEDTNLHTVWRHNGRPFARAVRGLILMKQCAKMWIGFIWLWIPVKTITNLRTAYRTDDFFSI